MYKTIHEKYNNSLGQLGINQNVDYYPANFSPFSSTKCTFLCGQWCLKKKFI